MKTKIFTIVGLLLISVLEVSAQEADRFYFIKDGRLEKKFVLQEDKNSTNFNIIYSNNKIITADTVLSLKKETTKKANPKSFDTLYCITHMPVFDFRIFNESQSYSRFSDEYTKINDSTLAVLLHAGIFDVLLYSIDENDYSHIIIRERQIINNNDTLYLNQDEAKHKLVYRAFDENNKPFTEIEGEKHLNLTVNFPDKMADKNFYASLNKYDTIYFSDASPGYSVYVGNSLKIPGHKKLYLPIFETLYGVDQSHIIENDPSDYLTQDVEFLLPDTVPDLRYTIIEGYKHLNERGSWSGGGSGNEMNLNGNEFKTKLFLSGEQLDNVGYHFSFDFTDRFRSEVLGSWGFSVYQNKIINSTFYNTPNYIQLPDGSSSSIGSGLVSFGMMANFYSNPDYNVLHFYVQPFPMGMYNECRSQSFYTETYKIYNASWQVLYEGLMKDYYYLTTEENEIYFEVLNNNFTVANKPGKAVNLMHFDFGNEDAIPPELSSLQVKNEAGKPIEYANTGEAFKISFTARDYFIEDSSGYFINHYRRIIPDSTRLYLKMDRANQWQELPVNNVYEDEDIGIYFETDDLIYSQDDLGYVDVKIRIADSAGNSTTLTVEPAFKIVDFYVDVDETAITKNNNLICYPNPFKEEIQVDYFLETEQDVKLSICNIQGQTIQSIYSGRQNEGRHQLQWNLPQQMESGIYYLVMKTEKSITTRKIVKL